MTCETSQFRIVLQAESDDVTRLIQMTKHKKTLPEGRAAGLFSSFIKFVNLVPINHFKEGFDVIWSNVAVV